MYNLTLEHLSAYFPYGLRMIFEGKGGREITLSSITEQGKYGVVISGGTGPMWLNSCGFKPILRPLSDLTKEIEHKGERFVPIEWFEIGDDENTSMEYDHGNIKLVKTLDSIAKYNIHNDINYLPYGVAQKLIKWHFDVFGLIEKKLAIDINTLK